MELDIHEVFIDYVKARRGERLKAPEDQLFTGEFWTARRGLDMGLVDGLGDIDSTLRARYGKDIKLKVIAPKRGWLHLPSFGLGGVTGGDLAGEALARIEDRLIWSRLGL